MRSARLAVAGLALAAGVGGLARLLTPERRAATVSAPALPPARAIVSEGALELGPQASREEGRRSATLPMSARASETDASEREGFEQAAGEWTITFVGRVVDERGEPIEGAELVTEDDVPRARSDATGWLVALPGASSPWNKRWRAALSVFAPGHASRTLLMQVHDGMTLNLGTVVLGAGADITGVVRDESRTPVANANVLLGTAADWPADEELACLEGVDVREVDLPWVRTDAQGRFRLRGAPARDVFVIAHARDKLWTWTELFHLRAGEDVSRDLVLPSDGTARVSWTVRILDPRRVPLPGARVRLERSGAEFRLREEQQADLHGVVRITVEVGQTVRLWARDPEERWGPAPEMARFADAEASFDLVLAEPAYVTLVVADPLGRPLPWSNVRLSSDYMDFTLGLRPLGEDGSLRVLLPLEGFTLRAFAPGYADAVFGPFDPRSLAIDDPLVLRLSPGLSVAGRVLAAGEPVDGAAVSLRWREGLDALWSSGDICSPETPFEMTSLPHGGQATTDSAGAFLISVQKDGWYTALVESAGFPVQAFGPFEVRGASSTGHEIVLARGGGTLEGRVLLPPGQSAVGRLVGASNGSGVAFTAPVEEDGRYRIENLAPGPYQVRDCQPPAALVHPLRATGNGTGEIVFDCEVREGATTRHDVDLSLEGSVVLEGSFRGPPGEACLVSLVRDGDWLPFARAELGDDGCFRMAVSRTDPCRIEIRTAEGLFRQPLVLVRGAQEWSASPSWGAISVRHPPQGAGPRGALVLSWRGPAGSTYEVEQWNNRMSLEAPPPVAFPAGLVEVLRVDESVRETLREPFTLLAGESVVLDLRR